MLWVLFALSALLMFAIGSIIDSISIKKYVKSSKMWLFYSTFIQGFIGIFIILFKEVNFYGFFFLIVAFITGLFYVYGLLPYMRSLEFEEVSRIAPLFNLGPVLVLIGSIVILNLRLSSNQYIGFFLLIIGSSIISIKKSKGLLKMSKGLWYMILTNLILAGFFIGTDYLFKNYDYWSSFFFIQMGILFSAMTLIFFKEYGKEGIKNIKNLKLIAKILIISVGVISVIGLGLRNVAISLSSAALVLSLGGFHSLFVLVIALIFSFKFSHIFKEETSKGVILLKIIAIMILILGVYFVSI